MAVLMHARSGASKRFLEEGEGRERAPKRKKGKRESRARSRLSPNFLQRRSRLKMWLRMMARSFFFTRVNRVSFSYIEFQEEILWEKMTEPSKESEFSISVFLLFYTRRLEVNTLLQ